MPLSLIGVIRNFKLPTAREQVVNQGGHVVDSYLVVLVTVGGIDVDARAVPNQQVVNQSCHVVDQYFFHFFHPVHMRTCFSLQSGKFVERRIYSGKSEKTKTKAVNSKNMFSVACHVGKMLYLRSL